MMSVVVGCIIALLVYVVVLVGVWLVLYGHGDR